MYSLTLLQPCYPGFHPCCRTMYRIAGNFRCVQIFAIFADRPASTKIFEKMMMSLRAYVEYPVNEMVLYSLSAL